MASQNDVESVFGHQPDGVDGEQGAHLSEQGELAELPENHVHRGGESQQVDLQRQQF